MEGWRQMADYTSASTNKTHVKCEQWRKRADAILASGRSVYLFGAGQYGRVIYEHIFKRRGIRCFIDNDPAKWGRTYNGLIVHSVERFLYEEPFATMDKEFPKHVKKPLVLVTPGNNAVAEAILKKCADLSIEAELFSPGLMEPLMPPSDFNVFPNLNAMNEPVTNHGFNASEFMDYLLSDEGRANTSKLLFFNSRVANFLHEMDRRAAVSTHDFIDRHMSHCTFSHHQGALIATVTDRINELDGHIIECGVFRGQTIRWLARNFAGKIIHGFDSFEGLPEDWTYMPKGSFDIKGVMPKVPDSVRLYKGWFEDTLPKWVEEHKSTPISLLRVDCDIYSSTKTVLSALKPLIVSGTWILFDELFGYRGWEQHEYKALQEFLAETGLHYEYYGFGYTFVLGYIK